MKLLITQTNAPAKIQIIAGAMSSNGDTQSAAALAAATLALGGGLTLCPTETISNDGTEGNAFSLTGYAVHIFTAGTGGSVQLPAGETGVLHLVANFTGAPMPVFPQVGATFLRSALHQPLSLPDTGVARLLAISSTLALWV